jgi:hypothetical protein
MPHCEPLAWYGLVVLLITGCTVLIPFLRGKSDLINGWNILLLGIAIFVGIGSIEAAWNPMRFAGLQWFEPTVDEVNFYLAATTIFLVVLYVSYYYDPISRATAARCLNKWPPIDTPVLLFVIIFCLFLAAASQITPLLRITFVGNVLINVAHKAFVFSTMFSFVLWYRNPKNMAWLGTFIVVFLMMCVLAMLVSTGRRLLLSVLAVPVVALYFLQIRTWKPTKSLVLVGVGVFALFIANLMYNTFRRYERIGDEAQERTASGLIEQVMSIGSKDWFNYFAQEVLWHFSQQVVHYAMLTDRYVATGELEAKPLNTFKFIAVYPVPRRMWPDKPKSLGSTITHHVLHRETSWGTGVAGHSAYEGGLVVAAMFGYFAAFGIRFFVDPLRRQPTNPFLIAMLATAAPHIVGWPRGDLSVMTFEIAECVFFAVALGIACRFLFGTETAATTSQGAPATMPLAYHTPAR